MEKINHNFQLYSQVSLKNDLPEHHLKKGDVGTVVEIVKHPEGKEDGVVLEIFNALGESMQVIAVPFFQVDQLKEDEILSVRKLNSEAA